MNTITRKLVISDLIKIVIFSGITAFALYMSASSHSNQAASEIKSGSLKADSSETYVGYGNPALSVTSLQP